MRSGYARLHTMQSCMHVSQNHMHALFRTLSHTESHKHTHTHYSQVGAYLSWMGCDSACFEPAGSSMSLTIHYTQQVDSRSSQQHSSLGSIYHLRLSAAFSSPHFTPCTCVYVPSLSSLSLFPSLDYSTYIFSTHSADCLGATAMMQPTMSVFPLCVCVSGVQDPAGALSE